MSRTDFPLRPQVALVLNSERPNLDYPPNSCPYHVLRPAPSGIMNKRPRYSADQAEHEQLNAAEHEDALAEMGIAQPGGLPGGDARQMTYKQARRKPGHAEEGNRWRCATRKRASPRSSRT